MANVAFFRLPASSVTRLILLVWGDRYEVKYVRLDISNFLLLMNVSALLPFTAFYSQPHISDFSKLFETRTYANMRYLTGHMNMLGLCILYIFHCLPRLRIQCCQYARAAIIGKLRRSFPVLRSEVVIRWTSFFFFLFPKLISLNWVSRRSVSLARQLAFNKVYSFAQYILVLRCAYVMHPEISCNFRLHNGETENHISYSSSFSIPIHAHSSLVYHSGRWYVMMLQCFANLSRLHIRVFDLYQETRHFYLSIYFFLFIFFQKPDAYLRKVNDRPFFLRLLNISSGRRTFLPRTVSTAFPNHRVISSWWSSYRYTNVITIFPLVIIYEKLTPITTHQPLHCPLELNRRIETWITSSN